MARLAVFQQRNFLADAPALLSGIARRLGAVRLELQP